MSRTPKRLEKNSKESLFFFSKELTKISSKYLKLKSYLGKDEAEIVIAYVKNWHVSSFINPLYLQEAKHDQRYRKVSWNALWQLPHKSAMTIRVPTIVV